MLWGFPCGSAGKESACNARDLGLIPGLGRSPGEGKGYPLQYSGLENSMDCIVHEVTKTQTWLSHFHCHFHWTHAVYPWSSWCLPMEISSMCLEDNHITLQKSSVTNDFLHLVMCLPPIPHPLLLSLHSNAAKKQGWLNILNCPTRGNPSRAKKIITSWQISIPAQNKLFY